MQVPGKSEAGEVTTDLREREMEDGSKMKKAFTPEIAKEVKINKINEQEKLLFNNQPEVSCLGVEGERKKRTM